MQLVKVGGDTANDGYLLVDVSDTDAATVRVYDVVNLADTDGVEGAIAVRVGVVPVRTQIYDSYIDSYDFTKTLAKVAKIAYITVCEEGLTYDNEVILGTGNFNADNGVFAADYTVAAGDCVDTYIDNLIKNGVLDAS